MRRYAYLKEPIKTNKKDYIYKIMLYQTKKDGVYLFMYCQKDAVQCSFDYWYKTVEDVCEDWNVLKEYEVPSVEKVLEILNRE